MDVRRSSARWVIILMAVVFLGVGLALLVWSTRPGLLGFPSAPNTGTQVTATVMQSAPCSDGRNPVFETIAFDQDGIRQTAQLDGCGHREGEILQVVLPVLAQRSELVVHAAEAATGAHDSRHPLALTLMVLSSLAGAGYVLLLRRDWINSLFTRVKLPS